MSTTVSVGGFEVTGTTPADAVVSSLTSTKEGAPVPKVLVNEGQKVEEPEKGEEGEALKKRLSEAASELGKLGGKAAAEKRAAEAKKGNEADNETETAEAKSKEDKDETGNETEEKPLGKPRDDPRARMLEATRKEAEAKRQAAAAAARAEALERRLQALERERQSVGAGAGSAPGDGKAMPDASRPTQPTEKPRPDQFDDYEKYLDARDDYNRKQWEKGLQERQQAATERMKEVALQRTVQGVKAKFFERVAGVAVTDASHREKFASFMESVSPEIGDLRPSFDYRGDEDPNTLPPWQHTVVADLIVNSASPRALMLHLTEDPSEFQRLAALQTPHDITWEMAKLEARLEAATAGTSPKPEPSKAKPPVRPVTGSPHIAEDSEYRPGMSFDDYAKRNAKRFKFPKP